MFESKVLARSTRGFCKLEPRFRGPFSYLPVPVPELVWLPVFPVVELGKAGFPDGFVAVLFPVLPWPNVPPVPLVPGLVEPVLLEPAPPAELDAEPPAEPPAPAPPPPDWANATVLATAKIAASAIVLSFIAASFPREE
jgi:hypothetical protein